MKIIENGPVRKAMLEAGTLRVCGHCDFETTERKYMKQHERSLNHVQDTSLQREAKKYTPEEKIARSQGRKKWLSA